LFRREISILFAACLFLGCGYHFGARLPEDIATLQVPVFANSTLIRGVEFELTETLTRELKGKTSVRLVDGEGDARLSGAVVAYGKVPVYESAGDVIAGRITVTVSFALARGVAGQPVTEGSVTETQDFDTRTGTTETDARREALREIARKIVSRIEAW
jgi:hypothetical protein